MYAIIWAFYVWLKPRSYRDIIDIRSLIILTMIRHFTDISHLIEVIFSLIIIKYGENVVACALQQDDRNSKVKSCDILLGFINTKIRPIEFNSQLYNDAGL